MPLYNPSTGITALTGDVAATGPGSAAATLATVNSNVGSFGSSTAIPSVTVNAKGLVTAASTNAVVAPAGTLTGTTLASNVVTSSLTALGTIATGVWNASLIPLAYGGTNKNMTAVPGGVVWTDSDSMEVSAAGTSGQYLKSNGTSAPAFTSFTSFTTQSFGAGVAQTYTLPPGCTAILVQLWGPGGGGGGTAGGSNAGAAGGGGSGAYVQKFITNPGGNGTYTVGAGGNGAAAGNNTGSNGSAASTFTMTGGISLSAGAGNGGSGSAAGSAAAVFSTGSAGSGSASGGEINMNGQDGFAGLILSASQAAGGRGGSVFGGNGAVGGQGTQTGSNANGFGGGGGGGSATSGGAAQAGGGGAPGRLIVWEFYP